ncbi:carbohydrate kinase family protein [Streptococcus suis]|nr:carbohydrate kinase family protein [Streptococcus suis]
MGKCLVIGSTVCDVMIYLDQLPGRQGDAHIDKQVLSLGGCAFNVVNILHHMGVDYDFISPVGTGIYGHFVRNELEKIGIEPRVLAERANGCCYCFIESDGERTFLSDHGVEYHFDPTWLDQLDLSEYDYAYVCGLEVEEETGQALVDSLETIPAQLIFAPGPRGHLIDKQRMEQVLDLSPILHVNEQEALTLSGQTDIRQAVQTLNERTGQALVVTRGEAGALAYDGQWHEQRSYPAQVVDAVGAGDSHVGALLAGLASGKSLDQLLDFANRVASYIVANPGVHLPSSTYEDLRKYLSEL